MAPPGRDLPPFVRLAAHPVRWRLLGELAASDHRVRELVELVGEPQSLVSYHLRLLRDAELVVPRRSSFDGRDSYYHLDLDRCGDMIAATGVALHPALQVRASTADPPALSSPVRVLFACTGNSARSPMAEALLRHRAGATADVTSAGSHPKERIHPSAVRVLADDYGIDIAGQRPRQLSRLAEGEPAGRDFDYVVTLCDKVREVCPEIPGHPRHLHWSIADPTAVAATDRGVDAEVRRTARDIDVRVGHLIHVLAATA